MIAAVTAFPVLLKYAKLWELQRSDAAAQARGWSSKLRYAALRARRFEGAGEAR